MTQKRVSGQSVIERVGEYVVHPCREELIYSNSRVRGKGLLGCLYQFIDK